MPHSNINYQFNTTINTPAASQALIAITPYHSVEMLSKQHLLLSHTEKQHTLVLANYLVNVIEVLKTFRTLDAHVKEIKTFMQLDNSAVPDIKNVIQQLQQNHFIITAKETLSTTQQGENYRPLQTPPVVVVRTAGRVAMLKRFLHSAVENEQRYNARYEYLIIDESTPEQAEANAINIANSGLKIQHIDRQKQQDLLNQWLGEYPEDQTAIQFLLGEHPLHELSPTYGRSWNWGVLLSAGKPVVFLDDDCLLEVFASPVLQNNTVGFGGEGQATVFLDKAQPLNQQLQAVALDPIAKLAENLGLSPQQLPCGVDSFTQADYQVSEKLGKAHVVMTNPAVAGDPGSASPLWLYFLRDEAAKRFLGKNESDYTRHKTERFLFVGDTRPQLAFSGGYSVVARALDNRELLPPTLPVFRNEDALFTNLVQYLYPYGATLSVPWGLSHLPEIERQWKADEWQKPKGFDVVMALDEFLDAPSQLPPSEQSPTTRLLQLSEDLRHLFSAEEQVLMRWQYQHQQAGRASQVRALQNALDEQADAPAYWRDDIDAVITANVSGEQALSFGHIDPKKALQAIMCLAEALPVWVKLWKTLQHDNNKR